MKSTWNTPDTMPYIDDAISTSHGYMSFDLILIYRDADEEEHISIGWYGENGNWYLQGQQEPLQEPAKVVLWTEYPNDIWRKMEGWLV